jgi:hypothetical protein
MGNNGRDNGNSGDKGKMMISLLISLCFLQTLYMNLAAFFPIVAEKEYDILGWQTGIVLA